MEKPIDRKSIVIQEIIEDTIGRRGSIHRQPLELAYQRGYEAGCVGTQNQMCCSDMEAHTNQIVDLVFELCCTSDEELKDAFGISDIRGIFRTYTVSCIKRRVSEINNKTEEELLSAVE